MSLNSAANPLKTSLKLIPVLLLSWAFVACGGGSSTPPPPPPPPAPTIASFAPTSGLAGASVTVTGTSLTGATALKFNGATATFTVASATQITATVPAGATTGTISVTTARGTATSASSFTVTVAPPTISSFTPTTGPSGTGVTITGTNFTGTTNVSFNGAPATFSVTSTTQITTTEPVGATTGPISVTTPAGGAVSASNFTVTIAAPTISSFTPTAGPITTPVTITGTNFTGATAVKFNGTTATFIVASATQITTTVPAGSTTGPVTVTTPGGTATSASNFTVNTSSTTLDLSIDGLYITQATQDYPSPIVPLVKDRSAWVRVFVKANQTNTVTPQVRVRFINGATTNTLTINAPSSSVPTSVDPNTDASWNAAVSSTWILAGTQVIADLDPSGAIPEADKTNNSFTANLDVRTLKPWKVTLVPIHTLDGRTGNVSTARTAASWLDFAKRLHPVPDTIDIAVGSILASGNTLSSNGNGWQAVLTDLRSKRIADGVTDRYYYGVVNVNYSSGVAGLGFIGYPVAMGWDVASSYPDVLAHEEGHNFGRDHSPCGAPPNPDPNYPYPSGNIGVTGWDVFAASNNLKDANTYTDIMGYCSNQWISDYTYSSELTFRAGSPLGIIVPAVVGASLPAEGLLIWGRIENGVVTLEPAFRVPFKGAIPVAGPYTLEARDSAGTLLASLSFDADEVADLPDTSLRIFSFVVPLAPDTLNSAAGLRIVRTADGAELVRRVSAAAAPFTLTQPGTPGAPAPADVVQVQDLSDGGAQFTWDAVRYPVIMVRDATTGEVRGFLRGGSALIETAPADLEVQSSDGVRSQPQRHLRAPQ